MSVLIKTGVAFALAAVLVTGAANAQQTPPRSEPPATTMKSSEPTTWDKTKAMTRKQWNTAKRKWATEKEKWADCNDQSKRQKLTGAKSWSFIASCMTS